MTTPGDLANQLGVGSAVVRKWLRGAYPGITPGKGGSWVLDDQQVAAALEHFRPLLAGVPPISRSLGAAAAQARTPHTTAWDWEGNVQAAVARRLERDGWSILSTADTARRQRGDDIRAMKDGRELVVEVKGWPPSTYADPRRTGEVKRTNPTVQAHHWLATAILGSMRVLGTRPDTGVSIALPDHPRYRDLVGEIGQQLSALGIDIIWVTREDVLAVVPGAR
jgi:hypothetical protein